MRPSPRPLLFAAILASASLWLGSCTKASVDAITWDNAFFFYRGFERLTKEPHRVHPMVSELCVGPTPTAVEALKRDLGPHFETSIFVYANTPLASRRTLGEASAVGTVIVKEKLGAGNVVLAVGGMRKRAPGYDPRRGDWEYFYASGNGDFAIGPLNNCADCHHASSRAFDHVFLARLLVTERNPPKTASQ